MTEPGTYKRSLGLFELVSLGVGGTIGSGIFVVPGIAAKLAGPAALLAWIIVALSASCVLLSLTYVSYHFTQSQSFFSLFSSVFGKRVAFMLISLYLISSIFGVATIAAGIGQYITYFGLSSILFIEIAIIALFCWLNITGISLSGITENILTALKIIPLLLITLLLIPFIKFDNFIPQAPVTSAGLLAAVIIVYWPFTGFEISAIPVEETKDTLLIRRALFIVMAIVVSLYLVLNVALIGSVGSAALAASPAPIATASGMIFAHSGTVVACIGIVAMLSALNAYIVATSRVLQSAAVQVSLPKIQDLTRQGTPAYALVLGSGMSAGLLLFSNHFEILAIISVITTLIPYIFFCLAAWILVTDIKSRFISGVGAVSTAFILIIYFVV
jgi:amino acid transporter